jgi:hypothetical protein
MGERGPKPVDLGLLNLWEFEWYKAFHVLRDGGALPGSRAVRAPPLTISPNRIRSWVDQMKGMDEDEYLRINDLTCERISGERRAGQDNLDEVDASVKRNWAAGQKQNEIAELERYLNPSKIPLDAERRELWKALWRAKTISALKKICNQWASLRDVRAQGLVTFPNHVLANAGEFLRMKQERRFPKSDSPAVDEARLEYLSRGMAGIMADVSPMTGIERLRNMKHTQGGPLWKKAPDGREYCNCWRCGLDRSRPAYKVSAEAWWNGMALFMEVAGSKGNPRPGRQANEPTRNL